MKITLIYLGGILHLAFAVFHIFFWKLFKWKQSLRRTTPLNKGVMQVMNLCLIYLFLAFAYLSFFHAHDLIANDFGKTVLAVIAFFWLFRLIWQFEFFDWKKPFSIGLSVSFLALMMLYAIPVLK